MDGFIVHVGLMQTCRLLRHVSGTEPLEITWCARRGDLPDHRATGNPGNHERDTEPHIDRVEQLTYSTTRAGLGQRLHHSTSGLREGQRLPGYSDRVPLGSIKLTVVPFTQELNHLTQSIPCDRRWFKLSWQNSCWIIGFQVQN